MKHTICLSLFFSIFFSFQVIAQTASDKEKLSLLLKISTLINKLDNQEAYKEANEAVGKFPDEPMFYWLRGKAVTDLSRKTAHTLYDMPDEKYKMALSDFNKAIELNGDVKAIYGAIATTHLMYQQNEKALDAYNKLYDLFKKSNEKKRLITVLANRAVVNQHLNKYEDAIKDFQELIAIEPKNEDAYNNLSVLHTKRGDFLKAYETLDKGLAINPQSTPLQANYGFTYIQQKKYKEAIKIYTKLIEDKNPPEMDNKGLYYNNRGYAKMELGKLKDAMKDINESFKHYPENSYAFRNRGLLYLKMKQKDLACQDFQQAEKYGFSNMYGDEVKKLLAEHCK